MIRIILIQVFILCTINCVGQQQYVINSNGKSSNLDTYLHDYSIGEVVVTSTLMDPYLITQGFLQPLIFWSDFGKESKIKLINNYLSPNGDGKNDVLKFEGLENFKINRLIIVDRSGRTVFSKNNYENDWDGRMNGKDLAEDTYYWILEYGQNNKLKGFVSITHDDH